MTDDGRVSPTGRPQEPFNVRQHEQQQAHLAASSDVGGPTASLTMTKNADKLNSKASVFSQVGRGFARGVASIVGAPLLIAGAVVGVPLVALFAGIDLLRAKAFGGIGYGMGAFADWVAAKRAKKSTTTTTTTTTLSKAESWRDTGIGLGRKAVLICAGWAVTVPLVTALLGGGALRFGIGKESFDSASKKVYDATENAYSAFLQHLPKKSAPATAVDFLNDLQYKQLSNIKWSIKEDGSLLATVKGHTQEDAENGIVNILLPYNIQFNWDSLNTDYDETTKTALITIKDPAIIESLAKH